MLSPREGTPGICGAFDFSGEFLVKIPTIEPQNLVNLNQIKYPHLEEVKSLNSIVVVEYISQIIGYILPSFFVYSFDALCNPRKIINKSSV